MKTVARFDLVNKELHGLKLYFIWYQYLLIYIVHSKCRVGVFFRLGLVVPCSRLVRLFIMVALFNAILCASRTKSVDVVVENFGTIALRPSFF